MRERPKYLTSWKAVALLWCLLSIAPFAKLMSQNDTGILERKLRRDAARLAIREIQQNGGSAVNTIEIPKPIWDKYFSTLKAIYHKNPTAQALEQCNVHTSPSPAVDHLILIVKKGEYWVKPLTTGSNSTSNEQLNQLIVKYQLQLSLVDWDDEHVAVTINSPQPLHMEALGRKAAQLVNIIDFGENSMQGDGNDIQAKETEAGIEVKYIFRFGSHFGRAGKSHWWAFLLSNNPERVSMIGEGGDEVPSWTPCPIVKN